MLFSFKVVTLLLVAITMGLSLAHALELPGKKRLGREAYLTVQTIYYPGFTIGGFAEPLSAVATLVLFFLMRSDVGTPWLMIAAFASLLVMHAIFWIVVQPVNRYWLRNQQLEGLGQRFFAGNPAAQKETQGSPDHDRWMEMRNRWEYSHFVRAILSLIALIALSATVIYPQ